MAGLDGVARTPVQKIADVIDKHTPTGAEGNVQCWCGEQFDTFREHAEHAAAAVLASLGAADSNPPASTESDETTQTVVTDATNGLRLAKEQQ